MQIVFDFLTGKVGCEEFKTIWYSDPSIGQWLENLIDLHSDPNDKWSHLPYPHHRMVIYKHYQGSVLEYIRVSEEFEKEHKNHLPKWLSIGGHFDVIASVVIVAYPETNLTSYYEEEREFYRATQADYLGGREVESKIGAVLDNFPRTMGKTKRKKEAKAAIKELFHLESGKYPRWAQDPEWPMGKNSPMAFVSQKKTGDLVKYTFRDVDTGKIRIVEQFY